jgi:hypothetical protein
MLTIYNKHLKIQKTNNEMASSLISTLSLQQHQKDPGLGSFVPTLLFGIWLEFVFGSKYDAACMYKAERNFQKELKVN